MKYRNLSIVIYATIALLIGFSLLSENHQRAKIATAVIQLQEVTKVVDYQDTLIMDLNYQLNRCKSLHVGQ